MSIATPQTRIRNRDSPNHRKNYVGDETLNSAGEGGPKPSMRNPLRYTAEPLT